MEERLAYSGTEQDMVLLHHEIEVDFPNGRPSEKNHRATLLEFVRTDKEKEKSYTAMASTVGISAAIGALLIGVLRPIDPEIYFPALDILEAYGFRVPRERTTWPKPQSITPQYFSRNYAPHEDRTRNVGVSQPTSPQLLPTRLCP